MVATDVSLLLTCFTVNVLMYVVYLHGTTFLLRKANSVQTQSVPNQPHQHACDRARGRNRFDEDPELKVSVSDTCVLQRNSYFSLLSF